MLRFIGVILLCTCVCAMPSYAAIQCGGACETASVTHEHQCCPDSAIASASTAHGHHSPSDTKHDGKHHCAAPCCGYVAHVLADAAAGADAQPLVALLPGASVLHAAADHDAIFHPPRV